MSELYELTADGLKIPDVEAFGFDGAELYEHPDFEVVSNEFERERRSYTIYTLVIAHMDSCRFFATEYSRTSKASSGAPAWA